MAIAQNTLPSIYPEFTLPVDASLQFGSAQTLTASGYVNNVNQQIDVNPGRLSGLLALDITAWATGSANEYYQFYLMGSNDPDFGNGNVELLTAWDIAAASANRMVPTILGPSPTIPPAGRAGALRALPFTTYTYGGYVFQYLQLYCVMGGTDPSITLSAWLVPFELRV